MLIPYAIGHTWKLFNEATLTVIRPNYTIRTFVMVTSSDPLSSFDSSRYVWALLLSLHGVMLGPWCTECRVQIRTILNLLSYTLPCTYNKHNCLT